VQFAKPSVTGESGKNIRQLFHLINQEINVYNFSNVSGKNILFSIMIAAAASGACMAQSVATISVALGGGAGACTSVAMSVTDGFSAAATTGSAAGAGAGKPTVSPVTIQKSVDKCTTSYIADLFRGSVIPTVTIMLLGPAPDSVGSAPVLMTITLTNAFVTSLTDADSTGSAPVEKATLTFETIKISDPSTNTTTTCSAVSNTCS
jgi:type VI protein secretion system component Hcp